MTVLTKTYLSSDNGVHYVIGIDARGGEYTHLVTFTNIEKADALLQKVRAAGARINDVHWSYRAPYGTQAWLDDGMEEATIYAERYEGLGEANEHDYRQEAYGPSLAM
jgi:hypothetical protein